VEAYGGTLRIRSAPGSGTTATVRFPHVDHPRTEASRPSQTVSGELASVR